MKSLPFLLYNTGPLFTDPQIVFCTKISFLNNLNARFPRAGVSRGAVLQHERFRGCPSAGSGARAGVLVCRDDVIRQVVHRGELRALDAACNVYTKVKNLLILDL